MIRFFVIVFLITLNSSGQILPESITHKFYPKQFDSLTRTLSYNEFFVYNSEDIISISYVSNEYEDGSIRSTYESFKNKEYKIVASTWNELDPSNIYNDGTCNCTHTVDTIYFKERNTKKISVDTLLMKKGKYQVTKEIANKINKEKFIYDRRNRLQTYYFGNSVTNFRHKKNYAEYKYYRADTLDTGIEQYEKEGYVNYEYVVIPTDPTYYEHVIYNTSNQIIKTYTLDNFFEGALNIRTSEFSYNEKGLPSKERSITCEINGVVEIFNSKKSYLEVLLEDVAKIDQALDLSESRQISEKSYLYDKNKLIKVLENEATYYNKMGLLIKEALEEGEYDGVAHIGIEYKDNKKVIKHFYNNKLSEMQEFSYDEHGNFVEILQYNYVNDKKSLVKDVKREITYKKTTVSE
ncbi:hypothetical protein [uncultured Aquimarina sp.]|uniref:hypothetical protein n=1 Tax=uncultured Aquimarina sp. TaxID=575652 RepID=UPI00260F8F52|nr:hypothetical protein [uncultured Aquimarina sp.]